ncbi:MAG: bacillithiol biosynthesis cysteine-adding enzyme BshC [Balneolaceae bacterium]|nr:bacillithiol biosynthesis cysteine-adding enzyme BshC [Balneolaceae bacterium]
MKLKDYSFDDLPLSDLFKSYVSDYEDLAEFYSGNPYHMELIREHAEKVSLKIDAQSTIEALSEFNHQFDVDPAALDQIDRFSEENALAIVTGQQLGIYGGPLYTVYKSITAIRLAALLEQELDMPVIPVFWLADEDHDFEEVKSVGILDRDDLLRISYERDAADTPPVSEIVLDDRFEQFRSQVEEQLQVTDFTDRLWTLLDRCYQEGATFGEAFGKLMAELFSKHGLVFAGSNFISIKRMGRDCLKAAVENAEPLKEALENQSTKIGSQFHQQAAVFDSNLFYLDEEAGRTKVYKNESNWHTDQGGEWSTEELLEDIEQRPERFSPNVFLRPVFQDRILPTLGYVGGPGEIAYYGQMKQVYELYELQMPIVFPRMSGTIVEPAIDRILDELPFELWEYGKRIEDLESEFVDRTEQVDIESIFEDWKQQVEEISEAKANEIAEIDPTLEGAAGKATAVYSGELDKLKGKVYRSVKQQEQTQLNRIAKIKAQLFPERQMQERSVSFIYYMNKYGLDIWDRLIEQLELEYAPDRHKLIYP